MRNISAALAVASFVTVSASLAQAEESDEEELDAAIDEVTVVGIRTLATMRAEVIIAEDEVYALFNELNEDDGYDIICKKETRIGSQIPRRVCKARMYRQAVADATVDDDISGIAVGNMTRSSKHEKMLQEKMRALAIQHPELLQALRKRYALDREFREARDTRFGD